MHRNSFALPLLLLGSFLGSPITGAALEITLLPNPNGDTVERLLAWEESGSPVIVAAGANSFYRMEAGGEWEFLASLPAETRINDLARDDRGRLWIATSAGLWLWQADAFGRFPLSNEEDVSAVAAGNGQAFAASASALWRIADLPERLNAPQEAFPVRRLEFLRGEAPQLVVAGDAGVFVYETLSGEWHSSPVPGIAEQTGGELPDGDTGEEKGELPFLRALAVNDNPRGIAAATARGVLLGAAGRPWRYLPSAGLPSRESRALLWVQAGNANVLLNATPNGLAAIVPGDDAWSPLEAPATARVTDLIYAGGAVWAACDQGLLRLPAPQLKRDPARRAAGSVMPTARQVQEAAIRYAEAQPEKILNWRKRAAVKAILPSLSIGYDRDRATYITSRGSTDEPGTDRIITAEDPSHGFDISLTWKLDELIWSAEQTSIDNRSRLMVQLREDIVDQVTRLYFERLRLDRRPMPADPDEARDRSLRIEELTALIDGLTGGYFSEHTAQAESQGAEHGIRHQTHGDL